MPPLLHRAAIIKYEKGKLNNKESTLYDNSSFKTAITSYQFVQPKIIGQILHFAILIKLSFLLRNKILPILIYHISVQKLKQLHQKKRLTLSSKERNIFT